MRELERWDDLRVLLAVLRHGSFSAAARVLAVEQSTVSRRIAALEDSLGSPLFERLPDGPRPSELALKLQQHAERIAADVRDLTEFARGDHGAVRGKVTLALSDTFAVQVLIPYVLGPLRKRHPELAIHLLSSDRSADLMRREADIALRFYRPESGDLVAKRIARFSLGVLAHPRYAKRAPKDPSKLAWISVQLPGIAQPDDQLLTQKLGITPALTVSSHLAQVEAVRAGLGVALLARSILQLDRSLVELELGLPASPSVDLWLVTPRTLRSVPRVAAVWELLEERLAPLQGSTNRAAVATRRPR